MSRATRQLAIRDLIPDSILEFDLVNPSGQVILRKGLRLKQETIDYWLSLGFDKVMAACSFSLDEPLNPQVLEETAACTKAAAQRVENLVQAISAGEPTGLTDLAPVLSMIAKVLSDDRDAAIWSVEKQHRRRAEAADLRLANRCAKFSLLAHGTSVAHGLSAEESESVALAALLHDVALYNLSMESIKKNHKNGITTEQILRQHSLLGAELVCSPCGVCESSRRAMLEVHEQVDGTGYPRGLRKERLSQGGRILNLIDAYLSLTDPHSSSGLIPADAIAYLMKQTAFGAFDLPCMQSFLKVVSAYGIGTQVKLDDNSDAEVIRSSETDAGRPIIRLDDEHGSIVDLRHSSLSIREPRIAPADTRSRIRRSEMNTVLWRPTYLT